MQYYFRPLCYDDPSRQSFTQLGPDESIEGPLHFDYGELVRVGPDEDDPANWPKYYVAHLPRIRQIDDPNQAGKKALLFELLLAREAEWPLFKIPQELLDAEEL